MDALNFYAEMILQLIYIKLCIQLFLKQGKVVGKLEHESGSVLHSISYHPSQCCLITACGTTLHVWKSRLDQSMN